MTPFGSFALSTLALASIVGLAGGVLAFYTRDPFLAWMSGGLTFAPLFLILGRAWLRGEIEATPPSGKSK